MAPRIVQLLSRGTSARSRHFKGDEAEEGVGVVIVGPAAGRFVVVEETVLEFGGDVFAYPAGEAGLDGVLLIVDAEREAGSEIVLRKVGAGIGIRGEQIRVRAQDISRAAERTVDVSVIRNHGRVAAEGRGACGVLLVLPGERCGKIEPMVGRERKI